MAALFPKLAITLVLVLAWRRAGAPVDAVALRRRLLWALGLAALLRLALALLAALPPGAGRDAAAQLAGLSGLVLLWPLFLLALTGPLTLPGRVTRTIFAVIGLIVLWAAGPGPSTFLFWIALTRCAWAKALRTTERFWASLGALAVGLGLFLGVRTIDGLGPAAEAAAQLARFARGLGVVFAIYASTAAFRAFTTDPTLGVRRVSRRLVLSHVLVVTVPLVILIALWVSSTYLGVNAERALMTVRALDREGARLEESLRIALESGDAPAGARAMADERRAHWPGLRVYSAEESGLARVVGAPLPLDSLLTGWVAALDSLP